MNGAHIQPHYTQKHEGIRDDWRSIGARKPTDRGQGGGWIGSQQVTSWEDAIQKVICGRSLTTTSKMSYMGT